MQLFRNLAFCLFLFPWCLMQAHSQSDSIHSIKTYSLTFRRGWNWTSFPTAGYNRNKPALVYDLFKGMDPWPPDLLFLQYSSPTGPIMFINYTMCGWEQAGSLTEIFADRGYKLLVYPMDGDSVKLNLTGTLPDKQTLVTLEKGNNWVSYFSINPAYPEQCIPEDVLRHIFQIKTQYWSMTRITNKDTSWFIQGRITPLRFGDLVILNSDRRSSFCWTEPNEQVEIHSLTQPVHFQVEETDQYLPVYFSLDAGSDILEIAVMADTVMKGAAVREPGDTIAEVRGYFDHLSAGNRIAFKTWNGKEDRILSSEDYIVIDHFRSIRDNRNLFTGEGSIFYHISLKSNDVNGLPAGIGKVNCRNSPETSTFSFRINKYSSITISIFDLQGNVVKTLVNGYYPEGYYNLSWNGDNESGNRIEPGIYFYKVSTGNKTLQTEKIVRISTE
jgi:hypothetical protein